MLDRFKLYACVIAISCTVGVADAQDVLVDFESVSIGDQASTVSDLTFADSINGSSSFGDSLVQSVGVGSSKGILYDDLDIHPGTNEPSFRGQQSAKFDTGGVTPALPIGQSISMSVDLRIENATSFVTDNPFAPVSRVVTMDFFASGFSRPLLAQLIVSRGRVVPGQALNSDPESYFLGVLGDNFLQEASVNGSVEEIGLINNSPNEISDFFNVELVVKRNTIDDFGVDGFLRDENGLVLQTVSLGGIDFSNVYDGSFNITYFVSVDNTAYIAHESITFDNFRLKVSGPVLKGDVDMDGDIDFADIPPFISALQSGVFQAEADCNCDAVVTFADIPAFIALLQGQ